MSKVFLGYDQKALDDQYEQRVWVPHADRIIKRYGAASDEVRQRIGEPRTERYGPAPIETLDIYGEGDAALVFVHGGAWKRQSKRENAFAAETVVRAGAAYVALDFALLPTVTIDEMAAQVRRGIEWVYSNLARNVLLSSNSSRRSATVICIAPLGFCTKNSYGDVSTPSTTEIPAMPSNPTMPTSTDSPLAFTLISETID